METVKIKIVNNSNNEIPQYGHYASAGMDLRAWTQEPVTINPCKQLLTLLFICSLHVLEGHS